MLLNKEKNEIKKIKQNIIQDVIIYDYDMKENLIELLVQVCIQNQIFYWRNNHNEEDKEKQYMLMAQNIKQTLDNMRLSNGSWQVIVGQKFGSFVTHESFYFLHFSYQEIWYTLFVTG